MSKKRIGIVGATGYTGSELVRILHNHPEIEIAIITSESRAGEKFSDVHSSFYGINDTVLMKAEDVKKEQLDIVFLALPHRISMGYVRLYADFDFKIIDLSGDFRLSTPEVYKEWYGTEHTYKEGFKKSAYGLPELFADDIRQSSLTANPGCFPTGNILSLAPLLKHGFIEEKSIIIDAKTGVTGAGVKASIVTHFSNVNDNFKAYKLKNHRHTIEIEEKLSIKSSTDVQVQFSPHLLPVDRGILSTVYARPTSNFDASKLSEIYNEFYANAPFVRLRHQPPTLKDVRATNFCDIYFTYDERTNNLIIVNAIDNLVKGAAGQAVHNMNLMLGFDETCGLGYVPVNP